MKYSYFVLQTQRGYSIIRVIEGTSQAETVATAIEFEMAQSIAAALGKEFGSPRY